MWWSDLGYTTRLSSPTFAFYQIEPPYASTGAPPYLKGWESFRRGDSWQVDLAIGLAAGSRMAHRDPKAPGLVFRHIMDPRCGGTWTSNGPEGWILSNTIL